MVLGFTQVVDEFVCIDVSSVIRKPFDKPVLFAESLVLAIQFMGCSDEGDRDGSIILTLKEVDEPGGGTSDDRPAFALVVRGALSLHEQI